MNLGTLMRWGSLVWCGWREGWAGRRGLTTDERRQHTQRGANATHSRGNVGSDPDSCHPNCCLDEWHNQHAQRDIGQVDEFDRTH